MESKTWTVRDGGRTISFEGVCLSSVSSQRPSSPRWTDLDLYRTDSGKYVLSKVGRTVMLHQRGCSGVMGKLNLFVDEFPEGDPEPDFELHDCVPDSYFVDELLVEATRYWALIADSAAAVVENLHHHEDGIRTLPRMSAAVLEEASLNDQGIAEAFTTEHIS